MLHAALDRRSRRFNLGGDADFNLFVKGIILCYCHKKRKTQNNNQEANDIFHLLPRPLC